MGVWNHSKIFGKQLSRFYIHNWQILVLYSLIEFGKFGQNSVLILVINIIAWTHNKEPLNIQNFASYEVVLKILFEHNFSDRSQSLFVHFFELNFILTHLIRLNLFLDEARFSNFIENKRIVVNLEVIIRLS